MNLYFEDETRFGLFTKAGKSLTAKGVQPICTFQQVFQSLCVFGAFSPLSGDRFVLTLPYCNADNFQLYLNQFSKHKLRELKVIVLDNGAFHKAKKMVIPNNIMLIFYPRTVVNSIPLKKSGGILKDGLPIIYSIILMIWKIMYAHYALN